MPLKLYNCTTNLRKTADCCYHFVFLFAVSVLNAVVVFEMFLESK